MEIAIIEFLQQFQNPIFDVIAKTLAFIGDNGLLYFLIAFMMLCFVKYRRKAIFLLSNLIASGVVGYLLKVLIARERPCYYAPDLIACLANESQFSSCPSGHMIMGTAFVLVMIKYFPKYKIFFIGYLILLGISRMYLGVHYISDLLIAVLISFIIFVIISIIWKKFLKNR